MFHAKTPPTGPNRHFKEWQAAVPATWKHHKLSGNGTLTGTAALALYGLDAHVTTGWDAHKFDMDVWLEDPDRVRRCRCLFLGRAVRYPDIVSIRGHHRYLPFEGFQRERFLRDYLWTSPELAERLGQTVLVNGCTTFTPSLLAELKLNRGDPKDYIGLIQAQIVAHAMSDPIAAETAWQSQVDKAMAAANDDEMWLGHIKAPAWFPHLQQAGFDHPALR